MKKVLFVGFVSLCGLAVCMRPASASLLGTTVCGSLTTASVDPKPNLFSPDLASGCVEKMVNNNSLSPEFNTSLEPNPNTIFVDVLSEGFKFSLEAGGQIGSPVLEFTELSWIQGDGKITGVTVGGVMGFDNPGLTDILNDASRLSYTGNSVTLDLNGILLEADGNNVGMFSIDLDVKHTPESSTILGLAGVAVLSIGSFLKRKAKR